MCLCGACRCCLINADHHINHYKSTNNKWREASFWKCSLLHLVLNICHQWRCRHHPGGKRNVYNHIKKITIVGVESLEGWAQLYVHLQLQWLVQHHSVKKSSCIAQCSVTVESTHFVCWLPKSDLINLLPGIPLHITEGAQKYFVAGACLPSNEGDCNLLMLECLFHERGIINRRGQYDLVSVVCNFKILQMTPVSITKRHADSLKT